MELKIQRKTSGHNASVIAPDIERIKKTKKLIPGHLVEDYQDYCAFCAKLKWVFNEMEQVVCDILKRPDLALQTEMTHAWRCKDCKAKNKRKCFDGRIMTKEDRWNAGESTMERPRVWRDPRSRVIVGSQKRLK